MSWNRKLWGVELITEKEPGLLLGTAWNSHTRTPDYNGEPTRCLLFLTRKQAKEWCKKKNGKTWQFSPVRVIENISKIED
jgi:hypothetical protein